MDELDALPEREWQRWRMYWAEEPWGSYRDNMHAAMIAIEVLRPNVAEDTKLTIADFMFEHEEDRKQRARRKLLASLEAISIRKPQ